MGDRTVQVNLAAAGIGAGDVVVDGQDVSAGVSRLLLAAGAGESPRLVLELAPQAYEVDAQSVVVGVSPVGAVVLTQLGWRPPETDPAPAPVGRLCSALCADVERDRDALAAIVAAIGDAISPTGERPEEALATLAGDVARVVEQRDQLVEKRDQLVTLVREMLLHFTVRGHPGRPAIRTGWLLEKTVSGWRFRLHELAYPPDPPPE
ncbi:hypothetical protein [Micromonospora sp. NPDC048063]|uniref:hypothetical protein n=1 Tax=Micromonospora sp. NPDC048063 TaxID=3364256 RepID=UPI00371AC80B